MTKFNFSELHPNILRIIHLSNVDILSNFLTNNPELLNDTMVVACYRNNRRLLSLCFEHGADINYSNDDVYDQYMLTLAFQTGNKSLFYDLLRHPNIAKTQYRCTFHIMTYSKNRYKGVSLLDIYEMMEMLLSVRPTLINDSRMINMFANPMALILEMENNDFIDLARKYGATFGNYIREIGDNITETTNPLISYYQSKYLQDTDYDIVFTALRYGTDVTCNNNQLMRLAVERNDKKMIYRLLLFGADSSLEILNNQPFIEEWRAGEHRYQRNLASFKRMLHEQYLLPELGNIVMSYADFEYIIPLGDDEDVSAIIPNEEDPYDLYSDVVI